MFSRLPSSATCCAKIRAYRPSDDLTLVKKAYEFSLQHHQGQTRASGEPYLVHPLK